MTYEKLMRGSGIQWPCNEQHPDGCARLYTDSVFATAFDYASSYGKDPITGAHITPLEYKAKNPEGRAFLKSADYLPPRESPDEDYPFWLITGRVVYHFHTRTKTGRSPELYDAVPDVFVQMNEQDAARNSIRLADWVRIESRRGRIEARARLGDIQPGMLFVPFHYGWWDDPEQSRAANELTIYEWDAVSKQPHYTSMRPCACRSSTLRAFCRPTRPSRR
jgi:ferredoxin-nitrate reductase